MGKLRVILVNMWLYRRIVITLLAVTLPAVLLFLGDGDFEKERKCGYVILLMSILWLTEAIPISATAFIPVFIFPLMGVAEARTVSAIYMNDSIILFLGNLMVAVAVEEWSLHRRIALFVLTSLGTQPAIIMLGLMIPTYILSMWLSNTAAAALMLPIVQAIIQTFRQVNETTYIDSMENESIERLNDDDLVPLPDHRGNDPPAGGVATKKSRSLGSSVEFERLAKGYSICLAYAANAGGTATLNGTMSNIILKQQTDELYQDLSGNKAAEGPVTFVTWLSFSLPLSLINFLLSWLWLSVYFLRSRSFKRISKSARKSLDKILKQQLEQIGKISLAECLVLCMYVLMILLMLFRAPPNIPGWGDLFTDTTLKVKYVSDSTPAMLIPVLMFLLPGKLPQSLHSNGKKGNTEYSPLLTWTAVQQKVPWGIFILVGGGLAIAKMAKDSGLSTWMGYKLSVFNTYEPWIMNLLICCVAAMATEITSNIATTSMLLPVVSSLAMSTNVHPLYLMVSVTIACSFAYMLPVATPANAVVFSTGWLTFRDMVIAGLPMNVLAVGVLTLAINTWGQTVFQLQNPPDFLSGRNATNISLNTTMSIT